MTGPSTLGGKILEWLVPARIGKPFRRILTANTISNLGDGVLIAAGPLLAASLTDSPFLIAIAALAVQLPWLVMSLIAGVIADRMPRLTLIHIASWLRAAVLAILVALIASNTLTLTSLILCLFALGSCEVFLDTSWSSLVPDLVPHRELGIANARLSATHRVMNQLLGPALGGLLFAIAHALPYGVTVITTLLALIAIAGLRVPPHDDPHPHESVEQGFGRLRHDLAQGMSWLWNHAPMRVLTFTLFAFNITYGITWGLLVVWATQTLGLDAGGYGLLMAVSAIGGVVGAGAFGWLERHFSYSLLMRVSLSLEVLVHASFAMTSHWAFAIPIFLVFGAYDTVWTGINQTIRGRAVPSRMRGRVSSIYMLSNFGGIALGTPLGGAIASLWSVQAAMWCACAGTALALALVWRMLPKIADAGSEAGSDATGESGKPGQPHS